MRLRSVTCAQIHRRRAESSRYSRKDGNNGRRTDRMTPESHGKRPRVVLADDHVLLLDAFEMLLAGECDVVGKVGDGQAVVAAAETLQPDVIVLDVGMPVMNGLEAGRQISRRFPEIKLAF